MISLSTWSVFAGGKGILQFVLEGALVEACKGTTNQGPPCSSGEPGFLFRNDGMKDTELGREG